MKRRQRESAKKEQKAVLKEAKKSALKGRRARKPARKVEPETLSSDDSEPQYDDSSDTSSNDSEEFYEGMMSRCRECKE